MMLAFDNYYLMYNYNFRDSLLLLTFSFTPHISTLLFHTQYFKPHTEVQVIPSSPDQQASDPRNNDLRIGWQRWDLNLPRTKFSTWNLY